MTGRWKGQIGKKKHPPSPAGIIVGDIAIGTLDIHIATLATENAHDKQAKINDAQPKPPRVSSICKQNQEVRLMFIECSWQENVLSLLGEFRINITNFK